MAKSATISLSPSTVAAQSAACRASCTITNGDSDAYVTAINPLCYVSAPADATACSPGSWDPPRSPTSGLLVTGSGGTQVVMWQPAVFVPIGANASNQTWVIGAEIYWSTGEITRASTANLTVTHQP